MSLLPDSQKPPGQGRHLVHGPHTHPLVQSSVGHVLHHGPLICARPPERLIPEPLICTKLPEKQKPEFLISTNSEFPFQYGNLCLQTGCMFTFKEETSLLLVMKETLTKVIEDFKEEDVVEARLPFIWEDLEQIKQLKNKYLIEVEDLIEKYTGVVDDPKYLEVWEAEVANIGRVVKQHARKIRDRRSELFPHIAWHVSFGAAELKAKVCDEDCRLVKNFLPVKGQQETVQHQAINHNQPALIPATQAGLQPDLEIASTSGEVDNSHTLLHRLGKSVHQVQGEANLHQDDTDHVPAWQDINLTAGLAGAGPYSASKDIYPNSDLQDAASQGGQQQLATLGLATDVRLATGVLYQASDGEPDILSVGLDVFCGDKLSPASYGVLQNSQTLRPGLQAGAGNAAKACQGVHHHGGSDLHKDDVSEASVLTSVCLTNAKLQIVPGQVDYSAVEEVAVLQCLAVPACHAMSGLAVPGHAGTSLAVPGHAPPGLAIQGLTMTDHAVHEHALPGHTGQMLVPPDQAVPGLAVQGHVPSTHSDTDNAVIVKTPKSLPSRSEVASMQEDNKRHKLLRAALLLQMWETLLLRHILLFSDSFSEVLVTIFLDNNYPSKCLNNTFRALSLKSLGATDMVTSDLTRYLFGFVLSFPDNIGQY